MILAVCLSVGVIRTAHAQLPTDTVSEDAKESAKQHFERGKELLARGAWDAALAEFLRSRELYPSRGNTQNAAVALAKLERYDEALSMFEELVLRHPDLPDRASVDKEIERLKGLVGSIEIKLAARGASVLIDGRPRGSTPLPSPVRVSVGSHVVRVFKEGASPFEVRLDVAGGQYRVVEPVLMALRRSGRLKVTERSGAKADVYVDGALVGTTPWEGSLEPGGHMAVLRTSDGRGTAPVRAPVRLDDVTVLNLGVEPLDCRLNVRPVPASAMVALDGVDVGRGVYEGLLPCGAHMVEVAAEGFVPARRRVSLEKSRAASERVELDRDPDSPLWRKGNPSRVFVEARGDGVITPKLGGDVASGLAFGFGAELHAGYQAASGLGLGLSVGYLSLSRSEGERDLTVQQVNGAGGFPTRSRDTMTLSGPLLGAFAMLQRGHEWPWQLRLGAGVLLGSARDERSSEVEFPSGVGRHSVTERSLARYAFLTPEFGLARRLGDLELGVFLAPRLLFALNEPKYDTKQRVSDLAGADLFRYPDEKLVGSTLILIETGLSLRYAFH